MRILIVVLAGLACAGPAMAHDFWLQPREFRVMPGAVASATLQVGHGQARQRSPIAAERILALRSFGPNGVFDQRPGLRLGGVEEDLQLRLAGTGTYVVALETDDAMSNLPAIRFNDYLAAEGLTPAIQWRQQRGAGEQPGRELYSRRAKAIVEVGPADSGPHPQVTQPIGLTLEIVPERHPGALKPAEPLPVRVIYEGEPLPGALVKLTDLDADDRPVETQRTDSDGRASFAIPRPGSWLLNVVWTKPMLANRRADYLTVFSSLAFASPGEARRPASDPSR